MKTASEIRPLRALTSPFWVIALGLLLLNDHVFKGSGLLPGWLTGKLSDFAGLLVAPPLIAVLLQARTRHAVALCHVVVGLGFAALELSPELTRAANAIYHGIGFAWVSTSDPTDLMALLILPIGHMLTAHAGGRMSGERRSVVGQGFVAVGLLSCAASTGGSVDQQPPCSGPDCDQDGFNDVVDCNDLNPDVHPSSSGSAGCPNPGGENICDDGLDNDHDGRIDCEDTDCNLACSAIDQTCAAGSTRKFEEVAFLDGSTLTGTSVTDASCVGADSPEVIFQGTVSTAGVLTLGVPKGHGIQVRRECIDTSTELACSVATDGTVDVTLGQPGQVTVVVEALDPLKPGAFEVPVSFHAIGCGDGTRQLGEGCDDGNKLAGDGCGPTCQPEYDVLCAAMPIAGVGTTQGTFSTGTKAFVGACAGSQDLPEHGFRYQPSKTNSTITLIANAAAALYVTTGCGDQAPTRGCTMTPLAGGVATLSVDTQPGEALTVFVELGANAPLDATYTLDIEEP